MSNGPTLGSSLLQAIAEDKVREYFEAFPLETFEGSVTVGEVETAVKTTLPPMIYRAIQKFGLILDAVRLLGPCGEDDIEWLRRWGGDRIHWTDENRDGFFWPIDEVILA